MSARPRTEHAIPDPDEWLIDRVESIVDEVEILSPVEFNEGRRYLPQSVSRFSGYIDYDLTPWWREIIDCFDVASPVREVAVMKGVQVAYTTALESIIFYIAGFLKTVACMFFTADKDLSTARVENNIIPMFQQSGMDIFQSSDSESAQKTGKNRNQLQWKGGGYMIPAGAGNADKMRSFSAPWILMDEVDAWQLTLKRGGNPIYLSKDRASAAWAVRKILMGSTPLIKGSSHIEREYDKGDKRMYYVRCLKCGFSQVLRWSGRNNEKGFEYGFKWDVDEEGKLKSETVRYHCQSCEHPHYEHDKPKLFCKENAEWIPTAVPLSPEFRSYHLPALYSPAGMQPWYKCVSAYLQGWDTTHNRMKDVDAFQLFYNNILGKPFEVYGGKISFVMVSAHRRSFYQRGNIPNNAIAQYCQSPVLMLTCTVDVHHNNLRAAIFGWTRGANSWLIDYYRIEDNSESGCENIDSPAWARLREIIEDAEYTADDGKIYNIGVTLVDAGFANATVTEFCASYQYGVFPILGRDSYTKTQKIQEFAPFSTQSGTLGYRLHVDYYKDRLAPVLRRDWSADDGIQRPYQFNAPMDATDSELKELTREYRKEKKNPNGTISHSWHRPHGADNELWDLIVYGSAAVDIVAYNVCIQHFQDEVIDWDRFWTICEEGQMFYRLTA
jgi:phage terminase large subunit GpA-like protein